MSKFQTNNMLKELYQICVVPLLHRIYYQRYSKLHALMLQAMQATELCDFRKRFLYLIKCKFNK